MWQTARGRFGVDRTFLAGAILLLSFLVVSPSSVTAAGVAHSRLRRAAPKATPAARQPATAATLSSDRQMLNRLQDRQASLEKQNADFNATIRRQMNQLAGGMADSRTATQEMLETANKRIDSTQRLLKISVVLLLMLQGGTLLYIARQRPMREGNSSAWKGARADQEGMVGWREGEPLQDQEMGPSEMH